MMPVISSRDWNGFQNQGSVHILARQAQVGDIAQYANAVRAKDFNFASNVRNSRAADGGNGLLVRKKCVL